MVLTPSYELEIQQYIRPTSGLVIQDWDPPKPFTRQQAIEAFARRHGSEGNSHWLVRKWPTDTKEKAQVSLAEVERCLEIIQKAGAMEGRIERELGPAYLDLHHLRKPRWATLQQHSATTWSSRKG